MVAIEPDGLSLPRVAVLGPFGTYSHEAADRYFGQSVHYDEKFEIKDVFNALSTSSAGFGVVPQENTIFGSVVETYDSLRSTGESFVVGEVTLRIDHCLIARTGVQLEQVHTVLSHEQALGQCRKFLEANLPQAKTEQTPSTASAARALLDRPAGYAAICSRVCATLFHGLHVLREAIQTDSNNYTRFYVLARNQGLDLPMPKPGYEDGQKALFRITIGKSESSTQGVQMALSILDTHVSRMDRRPLAGVPFDFVYFIEVQDVGRSGEEKAGWEAYAERKLQEVRNLGYAIDLIGRW